MEELELGKATIVYEDQDGEIVEETVDNEMVVYARDHWMLKSGTDDDGNDLMSQIPRDRVVRVDRNVEKFEDQARTVRRRVVSFADELREKLPVDVGDGRGGGPHRSGDRHEPQSQTIPVEEGDEGDGR
ncbi:hypothetical protein OB920_06960 [Halobacteria archaeon HArc-gm2]|nr:hypothetical protein [Halobacteria archaeon HArc-gm2]